MVSVQWTEILALTYGSTADWPVSTASEILIPCRSPSRLRQKGRQGFCGEVSSHGHASNEAQTGNIPSLCTRTHPLSSRTSRNSYSHRSFPPSHGPWQASDSSANQTRLRPRRWIPFPLSFSPSSITPPTAAGMMAVSTPPSTLRNFTKQAHGPLV